MSVVAKSRDTEYVSVEAFDLDVFKRWQISFAERRVEWLPLD